MRNLSLLFLGLLLVTGTCLAEPTVKIGDIDWYTDYDQALKVAKQRQVPLWLHFGENPG